MKKCDPIFDYSCYQIPFFEDSESNKLYQKFINYFQNNSNTNLNVDFKDILVEILFILPESAREYKN
jgi:hypothetical protein